MQEMPVLAFRLRTKAKLLDETAPSSAATQHDTD